MQTKSPRILIFIVAYEAQKTIVPVIERIPDTLPLESTEILIIDDASSDSTFEQACTFSKEQYDKFRVTILKNPVNQGYGGNQKLGFRYAIDEGFDIVVLLHGDGQYAPECLPEMLVPFEDEEVDAVFGSRMLMRFGAIRGGMPLYKYIGNKILTTLQNHMLDLSLSEFHSGYRAYRTSALSRIPFESNTNDFHFDTEIIIQLSLAKLNISEVPIPTYYGDEICRVNGLRYAWDVISTTFFSKLQEMCICYRRQFDIDDETHSNEYYSPKFNFPSSHTVAARNVKPSTRVLDIGSGPGYFAKHLRDIKECKTTGADLHPPTNSSWFEDFIQCDLDSNILDADAIHFETVIALDVVEHLSAPGAFLRNLSLLFQSNLDAHFIFSTPNIAYFSCRLSLFFGQFNYGKRGILDKTHKRLFTVRTFRSILEDNGFKVTSITGIPPPIPLALPECSLANPLMHLATLLARIWPSMFAFQTLATAKVLPTTGTLLKNAKTHTHAHSRG